MKKRISTYRSKQKDSKNITIPKPKVDWNKEYANNIDR